MALSGIFEKMNTTLQDELDRAHAQSYRRSVVSRLHRWIRIIFFAEVLISGMGFFFFPFREAEVVKSYDAFDSSDFSQHLATRSGKAFMLRNDRLRDTRLAQGDTVYFEKNLFYKTEAVFIPAFHQSFFVVSKMTWVYIQAIFLVAAIASFYFSIPKDLPVKQGLSVMLEILCVLYLFI